MTVDIPHGWGDPITASAQMGEACAARPASSSIMGKSIVVDSVRENLRAVARAMRRMLRKKKKKKGAGAPPQGRFWDLHS